MKRVKFFCLLAVLAGSWLVVKMPAVLARYNPQSSPINFERDIRPLLSDRCFTCHGPDDATREAKLRLDDPTAIAADERPIVVPGKSTDSLLFQRIQSQNPDEAMPPAGSGKSLNEKYIEIIAEDAYISEAYSIMLDWINK